MIHVLWHSSFLLSGIAATVAVNFWESCNRVRGMRIVRHMPTPHTQRIHQLGFIKGNSIGKTKMLLPKQCSVFKA